MCGNISFTALLLELNFIIFWIGENVYLPLKFNLKFLNISNIRKNWLFHFFSFFSRLSVLLFIWSCTLNEEWCINLNYVKKNLDMKIVAKIKSSTIQLLSCLGFSVWHYCIRRFCE